MPRPLVGVAVALTGLLWTGSAEAHVVATPAFLPSGSSESITFAVPNERDDPMTAFALTAPEGVAIDHAHAVAGWDESLDGSTATWTGGSLASDQEVAFGVDLEADREPGVIELQAEQRYPDGAVVSWPVPLTITPADETPSQNLALSAVVGLIGVLAVVAIAMLARRRRAA